MLVPSSPTSEMARVLSSMLSFIWAAVLDEAVDQVQAARQDSSVALVAIEICIGCS